MIWELKGKLRVGKIGDSIYLGYIYHEISLYVLTFLNSKPIKKEIKSFLLWIKIKKWNDQGKQALALSNWMQTLHHFSGYWQKDVL